MGITTIRAALRNRAVAPFLAMVAGLMLAASAAGAQQKPATGDPTPLLPADTSSPRDTLRSFLKNTNESIRGYRPGVQASQKARRAGERAIETMDFSATPDGDSWHILAERLLFLKEILDRIELPPDSEIPGDDEIAGGKIKSWTIPNTRLTIERIESGRRAGEYLFSARTVARLDEYYRRAKHLPYKPGATAGAYDRWIRDSRSLAWRMRQLRSRLRSVDTSNPRSTLEGFLSSVNRAHAIVVEADAALRARPPRMTQQQAREAGRTAASLLDRAVAALDLSEVPQALRAEVGIASALMLKEVLDRMLLPPVDTVPGALTIAEERARRNRTPSPLAGPIRWRAPNTRIEIVEITKGPRQGQFLFSAITVDRIARTYMSVRDMPYRPRDFGGLEHQYRSPGTSKGFYKFVISTPGYLVPRAHFLGRLVEGLPKWFKAVRGGQTVWQWIALIVALLVIALAAWAAVRTVRRTAERLPGPLDSWLRILAPAVIAIIAYGVLKFLLDDVNLTGATGDTVTTGGKTLIIAMAAWAAYAICKALAETVVATPRIAEESVDASLARIAARVIGFLIAAWIVIAGIRDLGADVVPLLAGLGIGGLAVALAAQRTLANFIGSLILFANRPVRVGDFCRYGDQIGTVESIGLISTRIRSLERTIITVPNAEFSEMKLENYAARDQRMFDTTLQLRYETTPEQMRYVLAKLRELLLGHPMATPDPARVRFVGFGNYSKDVHVRAYLRCRDHDTFLAIQEDILLRVEDIVKQAGTGFAFPSQTAYLGRDSGIDAKQAGKAEAEVAKWRKAEKLPFPEFDRDEREQLQDTLDYPPEGSPDHEPKKAPGEGAAKTGTGGRAKRTRTAQKTRSRAKRG